MEGSWESESDVCLQSLQDLFLSRVNRNRVRRLKLNEQTAACRVSRLVWLTHIFGFVSLGEALKVGQTCLHFNQLTKSPLFVRMQVSMRESTKIDVSLAAFGNNLASLALTSAQTGVSRGFSKDLQMEAKAGEREGSERSGQRGEDKEAELETLRSVKVFLTDKLRQNE